MKKINKFKGENEFLSNFYKLEKPLLGVFKTSEHLFQAMKTLNTREIETIIESETPGKAKRLGKKVTLRENWEDIKCTVMREVLELKFEQNPELAEKLLKTKEFFLEEGNNWHDNYWGNCYCEKCKNIQGKNKLGILLMKIRNELEKE